jgi:hypothetical protein
MHEELSVNRIIKDFKADIEKYPDKRTGKNNQYELKEAGMGAFSVFF